MKIFLTFRLCLLLMFPCISVLMAQPSAQRDKTLIVFFDGLRPDYITPEQMPNLYAFRQEACFGSRHHSVFPTVTRVNSASYATGAYPATHGLLGNAIYIPEVNSHKAIGTSFGDLNKIPEATSGPILTALSLGELLKSSGEKMMVYSSGTTGQAFLQNHTVNGAIVNPALILPASFKKRVIEDLGTPPEGEGHEELLRHQWITDGLLKYSLVPEGPLVSAIWFSDPDGSAHDHGIGSEEAVRAIKYVDGQFGRILETLKNRNLSDRFNIIISADHGFVTHTGTQSLTNFLIREGLKKDKESDDVVVAEGAIHVKNRDRSVIQRIVEALHRENWVGAVFTKPVKKGEAQGWVRGTLSFDAIHYNHARSGDILVAVNWDNRPNDKGYAGTDFAGGVAGHGGSSPYEINIALFARGPAFKRAFTGKLPTSNVDIAPTVLGIYGIPIPQEMDGRVMSEFYKKGVAPSPGKVKKELLRTRASYPWGSYELSVERSAVGKYRYVNYAGVVREVKP